MIEAEIPKRYQIHYRKAMRGRSPRTAIRLACLECVGWQPGEVRHCTAPDCPLYPYRFGWSRPKKAQKDRLGRSFQDSGGLDEFPGTAATPETLTGEEKDS